MHGTGNSIICFGLSDKGLKRARNEDHFIVADLTRKVVGLPPPYGLHRVLYQELGARGFMLAVADGLGGYDGGDLASLVAVKTMIQVLFATDSSSPLVEQLSMASQEAHDAVRQCRREAGEHSRMASTLTAVHIGQEGLTLVHVGDSRAYRFRKGKLTLLSEDQTVVHLLQGKGLLNEEEARRHPGRHMILQALGQDAAVLPDVCTFTIEDGDVILLCTDGLSSYVSHAEIEEILAAEADASLVCTTLIEAANAAGGFDNATVVLARCALQAVPQAQGSHTDPIGTKQELYP